ncbi:MAG: ComEA family DNA-binding protein [Bacillota bacterium]|nr:ComEA family DNA-binding protein [Bacillota bacterium]
MSLNNKSITILLVMFILVVFVGGYKYGQERGLENMESVELIAKGAEISDNKQSADTNELLSEQEKYIYVHITGAVKSPGLYRLPEGARVNDGVLLAVPNDEANLDAINLAQIIPDGYQLIIPSNQEVEAGIKGGVMAAGLTNGESQSSSNGEVNINTADAKELADKLPGIGPVLAQRIIDYRSNNGFFQAAEDLTKVSGIGTKTFESLKELIVVR